MEDSNEESRWIGHLRPETTLRLIGQSSLHNRAQLIQFQPLCGYRRPYSGLGIVARFLFLHRAPVLGVFHLCSVREAPGSLWQRERRQAIRRCEKRGKVTGRGDPRLTQNKRRHQKLSLPCFRLSTLCGFMSSGSPHDVRTVVVFTTKWVACFQQASDIQ